MADSDSAWVICKDLLVVPVPSGWLMLTNRMMPTPDPVVIAAALTQPPLPDAVALYLVDEQLSVPLQRFLAGLTGPQRDGIVVVPWPWPGLAGMPDAAAAGQVEALGENLADFYGVPVHLPPGLAPSSRIVPVDDEGLEASGPQAAVRVLPRAQAAMRESVRDAVELASGGQEPSWRRLGQYLNRVAQIRAASQGPWRSFGGVVGNEPPSTVPYALGVYLARYGVPAGLDPTALARQVAPVTMAQLSAVLGGSPAAVDTGALLAGLLAAPGSAALVGFKPRGSGPDRLMWLMSDDGPEPGLWWVEPPDDREPAQDGAMMSPVVVDPASDDWRMVALRDPETRVVPVDPAGRAANAAFSAGYDGWPYPGEQPDPAQEQAGTSPLGGLVRAPSGLPVSQAVWEAVEGLPAVPADTVADDCVVRVASVLAGLGVPRASLDGDLARSPGLLATTLGGAFSWGRSEDLTTLTVGALTPVWLARINDPQHMVLVFRAAEGTNGFVLVETQAPTVGDRYTRIDVAAPDPSGRGWDLAEPLQLVTDPAGRLREVRPGATPRVWSTAASLEEARLPAALTDPSLTIRPQGPGRGRRPAVPGQAERWRATPSGTSAQQQRPVRPNAAGTADPDRVVPVRRDGWCQLYAAVLSIPGALADLLAPDPRYESDVAWLRSVPSRLAQSGGAGRVVGDALIGDVVRAVARRLADLVRSPRANGMPQSFEQLAIHLIRTTPEGQGLSDGDALWQMADHLQRWGERWAADAGDGFLLLLATAVDRALYVREQGNPNGYYPYPDTRSRHGVHLPRLEVFYRPGESHYDGWLPPTAAPPTAAPPVFAPPTEMILDSTARTVWESSPPLHGPGGLVLDLSTGRITLPGATKSPKLTPQQAVVLAELIKARGQVRSRDEIGAALGRSSLDEPKDISNTIASLRNRLRTYESDIQRQQGRSLDQSEWIITLYNRGWRLPDPAAEAPLQGPGGLVLDTVTQTVTVPGTGPISLSPQEVAVLAQLINAGRGLGIDELRQHDAFQSGDHSGRRSVQTIINTLRQKIGSEWIVSVGERDTSRSGGWVTRSTQMPPSSSRSTARDEPTRLVYRLVDPRPEAGSSSTVHQPSSPYVPAPSAAAPPNSGVLIAGTPIALPRGGRALLYAAMLSAPRLLAARLAPHGPDSVHVGLSAAFYLLRNVADTLDQPAVTHQQIARWIADPQMSMAAGYIAGLMRFGSAQTSQPVDWPDPLGPRWLVESLAQVLRRQVHVVDAHGRGRPLPGSETQDPRVPPIRLLVSQAPDGQTDYAVFVQPVAGGPAAGRGVPGPSGSGGPAGPAGSSLDPLLDPSSSSRPWRVTWPRVRALDTGVDGVARLGAVPSPLVRAAADAVSAEGDVVDCVAAVGRVLAAVGPSPTSWDDSVLPYRSGSVAGWLGGDFQAGSLSGLEQLEPGHVTAVHLRPPNQVAHMVAVERLADGGYLMIDPTGRGAERFAAFDPTGPAASLPVQLRAVVRLVHRPDGQLGQLAVPVGGAPRLAASLPAVPHPPGTRYDGSVLVVDSGNPSQRTADTLTRIAAAAQGARRQVIAFIADGALAPDDPRLTALGTVLQRYRWFGRQTVVVTTAAPDEFASLRERYRPVMVRASPAGLAQVWSLQGPDGREVSSWDSLSADLFAAADALQVAPDGHELPPVLAGLLAQNTWPEGEQYLRRNVYELVQPHVADALSKLRERISKDRDHQPEPEDRKTGAYDVILGLVRAAGGVADESEPRFRPTEPLDWSSLDPRVFDDGGPLRETFVFDYLHPPDRPDQADGRMLRKPWDDRLLGLMYTGKLSAADTVALARAVHEIGELTIPTADDYGSLGERVKRFDYGAANATVFAAIGSVLGINSATVAGLKESTDPVAENRTLKDAVEQIAGCALGPFERLAWLTRLNGLRDRLNNAGQSEHNRLLEILTETLVECR